METIETNTDETIEKNAAESSETPKEAITENDAPSEAPVIESDKPSEDSDAPAQAPEAFVPESAPRLIESAPEDSAADSSNEENTEESAMQQPSNPADPAAAIEAILFATGNSLKVERLSEVLGLNEEETRAALDELKERYAADDRGICLTELEDAVQLGTKGEYYEYLIKLAKSPKRMTLSDTVIETLSIIAYKQPVTRAEIERIRGVSCDHALNRLLEYELVEEVGRLDAPGKPLLFGTTEQFLRSFGVRSIQDLPVMSPEMMQDFKAQAEAEAEEDLKVRVDV